MLRGGGWGGGRGDGGNLYLVFTAGFQLAESGYEIDFGK